MSENMNAQTILDAGAALTKGQFPVADEADRIPFVVVPPGYNVKDLESLLPEPTRKRGAVVMLDAPSFIAYVTRYGDVNDSIVYADVDYEGGKYGLVCVINDHNDSGTPAWRDHRATLDPIQALEWKRWMGRDFKTMSQVDFAAFLEDNMGDIATVTGMPTGKDMLEMALAFEANSDKRFKKKIDLQGGGQHLEYVDQADEATSTKMRFFERFTIGIPVFQGSTDGYAIEARLKFRTAGGVLSFWYELVRPDRVFKTAVATEIDKIKEATGFTVLYGRP